MNLRFISLVLFCSTIFALPLKDQDIIEFIEARYAGDDITIFSMISEDFNYYQTPYIGLGLATNYQNHELVVTGFHQDSLHKTIQIGDRIHEINGQKVSKDGILAYGTEGELQQLIITKQGDSTFSEIHLPLKKIQSSQNHDEFLESIVKYGEVWHEYHIEIEDIVFGKNKISVLYHWEGSKEANGDVYHFTAIEIIYVDKKTDLINRVEGIWSEKQLRDQFK